MLKTIATHHGSGAPIVRDVVKDLGARLIAIDHILDAKTAHFDGVILLGGCDISPTLYGQASKHAEGVNRKRDTIEWYLARRALSDRKPIFGICRGHQMLTVACGGSLYQDVFLERDKTKIAHVRTKHNLVRVKRALKAHIPATRVNSFHHQAIRRMPFGFSVQAKASDGIIEGIYRQGYLGVQFHPEFMVVNDERWMSLFSWFVKERLR